MVHQHQHQHQAYASQYLIILRGDYTLQLGTFQGYPALESVWMAKVFNLDATALLAKFSNRAGCDFVVQSLMLSSTL